MKVAISLSGFVSLPENRSAFLAVRDLADALVTGKIDQVPASIFLHGPPGAGKSHLVAALVHEIASQSSLAVAVLQAETMACLPDRRASSLACSPDQETDILKQARGADLLVVENLQHLPLFATEALIQVIDQRWARLKPMVFTGLVGPCKLSHRGKGFPSRLTSRLEAGLVVPLGTLQASSRLRFFQELARKRQLVVSPDIWTWLADNWRGGCRQLEAAFRQVEVLAKRHPLDLDANRVACHLRDQLESTRPTVDRIAQKISGHFDVKIRHLQSDQRFRQVVWPRQVGMYLARQLTRLSLEQIGAFFGGRDHTTVLHACRKVEQAMASNPALSGTVGQLQAELA